MPVAPAAYASATGAVTITTEGAIATVRFARPDRRVNPLSPALLHDLADAARHLARRPDISVAILTGSDTAFCGGFDLKDDGVAALAEASDEALAELVARAGGEAVEAWTSTPPVTIAAVEGYALGGGLVMALSCDFRVARSGALFGLPEIDRGITPGWGCLPRLVATIGLQPARRMAILGERLTAEQAAPLGLVDRIADGATPALDLARAMAAELAAKPATPLRMNKRMLNASAIAPLTPASLVDVDQFTGSARGAAFRTERARFAGI